MKKRWKIKSENIYFKPYEAQDEFDRGDLIDGIDFEFIKRLTWPKFSRITRKKLGKPVKQYQNCFFRQNVADFFTKAGIDYEKSVDGPIEKADDFFLRLEEAAKMTKEIEVQTNLCVGYSPREMKKEKKTATIETIDDKDDGTKVSDIIDDVTISLKTDPSMEKEAEKPKQLLTQESRDKFKNNFFENANAILKNRFNKIDDLDNKIKEKQAEIDAFNAARRID